jgi:hypothetical protein
MESDRLKNMMLKNATEIGRLHARVHETVKHREESPQKRNEWEIACAEFHKRYNDLAFPGGYSGAFDRMMAGDLEALEAAICFLECRPYFFRSGYMFRDLLRKCKKAPLSSKQQSRLRTVIGKLDEWRRRKLAEKPAKSRGT